MIPILFSASATAFTTNGIGRLVDAIECTVTEERNGPYELYMRYPITGRYFDQLAISSIICAVPAPGKGQQPFRIYRISKPIDGVCEIYAEHISYQLSHIPVMPYTAGSCVAALNGAVTNSAQTNPFTVWTDKTVTGNFSLKTPRSFRELLGGTQGSILDVFGKGDYEFDGYTVKLYVNRGADRGVAIRYGKNLTDLTQDTDISETITGVCPFWGNFDGTEVVTLPEYAVWSSNASNYPYKRTAVIDFSAEFETAPTVAELRARANKYIEDNEIGIPKVNLTVSFIPLNKASGISPNSSRPSIPVFPATVNGSTLMNLSGTVDDDELTISDVTWEMEEEQYKVLERIYLCDTVSIYYAALGVSATAKVVKTVHNVLEDRYDSLEIGEPKTTLSDAVYKPIEDAINSKVAAESSFLQAAIDHQTELITGGLGGYVVMNCNADGQPQEILIMDTADMTTAVNVIRMNKNGIGFSTTGYAGPFTSAWTIDGHFNASFISTGTLNANLIKAGLLSDVNGNTTFNISTGELSTKNFTLNTDNILYKIQTQWVMNITNMGIGVSLSMSWANTSAIASSFYASGGTSAIGNHAWLIGSYNLAESHMTTKQRYDRLYGIQLNKTDVTASGAPTSGYVLAERFDKTSSTPVSYTMACYDLSSSTVPQFASRISRDGIWIGGSSAYTSYINSSSDYGGISIRCGDGSDRIATIELRDSGSGIFEVFLHKKTSTALLHISCSSAGALYYAKILGQNIQLSGSSSKRYKHDIEDIKEGLDPHKLLDLKPRQFIFNDDHPLQYQDMKGQVLPGFIAEEVAETYPAAVIHDNETGEIENWDERRIIPGMLALIQEQQKHIDQLEARLARLEKLVEVDP